MDYTDPGNQVRSSERKSFKDASPSEVKERVKETVAKGVAAVAGAIKGFTEEAKNQDLAHSSKEGIQKAGETTRSIAGTVREEVTRTKQEVKGSRSGAMGRTSSMGAMPPTSDATIARGINPPTNLERSSVSDMPNLRRTPLGTQEDLEESKGE